MKITVNGTVMLGFKTNITSRLRWILIDRLAHDHFDILISVECIALYITSCEWMKIIALFVIFQKKRKLKHFENTRFSFS